MYATFVWTASFVRNIDFSLCVHSQQTMVDQLLSMGSQEYQAQLRQAFAEVRNECHGLKKVSHEAMRHSTQESKTF